MSTGPLDRDDSDPATALQGIEPWSAKAGSKPATALQGIEPPAALQGIEPATALQGSDPATALQGIEPPALSRSAVDRAAERRGDPAFLADAWRTGLLLRLDADLEVAVVDGPALVLEPTTGELPPGALFLGLGPAPAAAPSAAPSAAQPPPWEAPADAARPWDAPGDPARPWEAGRPSATSSSVDPGAAPTADAPPGGHSGSGTAFFSVAEEAPAAEADSGRGWDRRQRQAGRASLRELGANLSDRDAGLLTHAVALATWHRGASFCPRCGAPCEPAKGGSVRVCTREGTELYPRSDPAMIVLVTDPSGEQAVLGRGVHWPARRFSCLAGFVEVGESSEQAVVREVAEEVGLEVTEVHYLGSQPWPFPSSLMLGFRAVARVALPRVDAEELAEARWYTREQMLRDLADGSLVLPPEVSIARRIVDGWLQEPTSG